MLLLLARQRSLRARVPRHQESAKLTQAPLAFRVADCCMLVHITFNMFCQMDDVLYNIPLYNVQVPKRLVSRRNDTSNRF